MSAERARLGEELARELLAVARRSIEHGLAHGEPLPVDADRAREPLRATGASFVTLERGGALRGCIGSLEAYRPLLEDVAANAFAAAFRDPRFAPLGADELADLRVHLSLISPLAPIATRGDAELLAQLRPGVDGLVLRDGPRRATFLPAVWEELPDPRQFLAQLRRKAGLPETRGPNEEHWRYTVEELAESESPRAGAGIEGEA